jgi:shikimate dehydrogenase
VEELGQFAGSSVLHSFDPAKPPSDLPAGAIVINATSLGLKAGDPAPMDLHRLPPGAKVYDMVYNPPQTALLRDAASLGLPHANGLSMLVHQGARSLEIWTGATVPVAVMQAAATAALS